MATTDVVQEHIASGFTVHKHVGNLKYEDITVTCGSSMSKPFYDWMQASIAYDHQRKEGAIITADADFKEIARQEFHQALITEIGLPGVDASSKEACKFTLKISPEYTETKYTQVGKQAITPTSIGGGAQKRWHSANFKLVIDGMDCSRVNKIDPLVIKQSVVENTVGERLVYQKEPAQIEFPNLVFYITENNSEPWFNWYKDFVLNGKSEPAKEKRGHLEYLAPDCSTVLFSVEFTNLGIFKYTPDKLDTSSDKLRNVKIEMYCEKLSFEYKPAGLGK